MQDYGFVVVVADEGATQVEWFLGHLRAAYPDAPVTVISDGARDRWYGESCRRHNAKYVEGEYLKRVECGGRWWHRTLTAGIAMGTRWIVKIDPDTRVWRRFRVEPEHAISGTLEYEGEEYENIQGACQAITADAATRILASPFLDDDTLRGHDRFAPDWPSWRRCNASAYLSTDWSLMWITRNLGLDYGDWSECGCSWRPPAPENLGHKYAVTHPFKFQVPPRCLGTTLQVVTTCKGRLDHLKQTLPMWLVEPGVEVIVVDYDCPQGTAQWVRDHHPEVTVVHATGLPKFNLAHARNLGAAYAKEGWLCFWDADWTCEPGWAEAIRHSLKNRHYLLADPIDWSQFGSVVVHSYDFRQATGYDVLFRAWGSEDSDFYLRLRYCGIRPASFPARYFGSLKHDDTKRTEHYDVKDRNVSRSFYDAYIGRKRKFMDIYHRMSTLEENESMLAETQRAVGTAETLPLYQATVPVPGSVTVYRGQTIVMSQATVPGPADHLMPDPPRDHMAMASMPLPGAASGQGTANPEATNESPANPPQSPWDMEIGGKRFKHAIHITNLGTVNFGVGNDISGMQ